MWKITKFANLIIFFVPKKRFISTYLQKKWVFVVHKKIEYLIEIKYTFLHKKVFYKSYLEKNWVFNPTKYIKVLKCIFYESFEQQIIYKYYFCQFYRFLFLKVF